MISLESKAEEGGAVKDFDGHMKTCGLNRTWSDGKGIPVGGSYDGIYPSLFPFPFIKKKKKKKL